MELDILQKETYKIGNTLLLGLGFELRLGLGLVIELGLGFLLRFIVTIKTFVFIQFLFCFVAFLQFVFSAKCRRFVLRSKNIKSEKIEVKLTETVN